MPVVDLLTGSYTTNRACALVLGSASGTYVVWMNLTRARYKWLEGTLREHWGTKKYNVPDAKVTAIDFL